MNTNALRAKEMPKGMRGMYNEMVEPDNAVLYTLLHFPPLPESSNRTEFS